MAVYENWATTNLNSCVGPVYENWGHCESELSALVLSVRIGVTVSLNSLRWSFIFLPLVPVFSIMKFHNNVCCGRSQGSASVFYTRILSLNFKSILKFYLGRGMP